jgi:drug/metabolite transporter (DMT)-like permease
VSVPWAVACARFTAFLLAGAVALAVGVSLRVGRAHLPAVAAVGLCDVGANVLFGIASTRGYLSVVAVLTSLYPVVTVALAAVFLHERIASSQRVGVAGALLGAAMITAG